MGKQLTEEQVMLHQMADMIEAEAQTRLETDQCCQGGINAKIHAVFMDLTHILKYRMGAE